MKQVPRAATRNRQELSDATVSADMKQDPIATVSADSSRLRSYRFSFARYRSESSKRCKIGAGLGAGSSVLPFQRSPN